MGKKKKSSVVLPVILAVSIVAAVALYLKFVLPGSDKEQSGQPIQSDPAPDITARYSGTVRTAYNTLNIKAGESSEVTARVFDSAGGAVNNFTLQLSCEGDCVTADGATIKADRNGTATVTVTAFIGDEPIARNQIAVTVTDSAPWYGGATYINGVLLVNKEFSIPESYAPGDLTEDTAAAANAMIEAAAKQGLNLWVQSGYRSYSYQSALYQMNRDWYGDLADSVSARPGNSEHQTGYAIDLNTITDDFGDTPEGRWVSEHAHEFGFILRYMKGKTSITGYAYEPWHLRYVGQKIAGEIQKSGKTLEEYLGLATLVTYEY